MASLAPKRLWGTDFQLQDLLEQMPGPPEFATRDFGLLTLAGQLSARFPNQLVLKGGFVLRHVHGILRFSKDVDSTRAEPAKEPLDADAVVAAIREASVRDIVRFEPSNEAKNNKYRLNLDGVMVTGPLLAPTSVEIEVSYREAVIDPAEVAMIGAPFFEEFQVLVMTVSEMSAEKLRTLAQRTRPTDLADLALMLQREDARDEDIGRLAVHKFKDVAAGAKTNIERNLKFMGADYDNVVPGLSPDAPTYGEAMEIVSNRIKPLIP